VWILFAASLLLYAATRLIAIEAFPIYFFCDEAVHSVDFREMVERNFHGSDGPNELWPAYFRNGRYLNLSLSVYVQGLASYLGGQNVVTVRTTSALASLLGAAALALALRRSLKIREWWIAVAFLAAMPGLFLHSRTGFECVLMFSAYGGFLYFYLRYREENPRFIFPAMLLGAATFYSYAPGQGVMLFSGLFLAISDHRYHWRHRRWALAGLAFGLLLFLPYLRFRFLHPQGFEAHLAELGSYWLEPLPLWEKFWRFARAYAGGFSPVYWFSAGRLENVRHVVPFEAFIPWSLAPFTIIGLVLCLARWRSSAHRVLMGAMLASAFSAAFVRPGITRNIVFFAAVALFATLGFDWLAGFVRTARWKRTLRAASFVLLAAGGTMTLQESLQAGPTHYRNYSLAGMQWGAQAVFRDLIPPYLRSDPEANIFISHIWANNPEVFPRFFGWFDPRRIYFASLASMAEGEILPKSRDLVLLTAAEFQSLPRQKTIERFVVRETITWPDGRTGFYFGHLHFRPEFVQEVRARANFHNRPEYIRLLVAGVPSSVSCDGGVRGDEDDIFRAIPHPPLESAAGQALRIEVFFDTPIALRRIDVIYADNAFHEQQIWAALDEPSKAGQSDAFPQGTSEITLPTNGALLNRLYFEIRGAANAPISVQEIRVVPESP
jgi:hypothetical protein